LLDFHFIDRCEPRRQKMLINFTNTRRGNQKKKKKEEEEEQTNIITVPFL